MQTVGKIVCELSDCRPGSLIESLETLDQPKVLRGLVSDWPLVSAARKSAKSADRYLRQFYNGTPVTVSVGQPEIRGRIFYDEQLSKLNFEMHRRPLDEFLDDLQRHSGSDYPPVHYVGSTTVDFILPGLRDHNDLDLGPIDALVSIWLGNQTCIAGHFDVPDNIACVVAGKRRFTLFPPQQIANLYVGPLDFTPAGQPISMVDFRAPDFEAHPRFRTALEHAQSAELEPGDAIFIPSMWWHHVEGLDSFNVLINYWWRRSPAWMGNPMDALLHALLGIRDLPPHQREAWKAIFSHYIFEANDDTAAHIPAAGRGILDPVDELGARRLRALLLKQLNR